MTSRENDLMTPVRAVAATSVGQILLHLYSSFANGKVLSSDTQIRVIESIKLEI